MMRRIYILGLKKGNQVHSLRMVINNQVIDHDHQHGKSEEKYEWSSLKCVGSAHAYKCTIVRRIESDSLVTLSSKMQLH